jgi:hypothetical protein
MKSSLTALLTVVILSSCGGNSEPEAIPIQFQLLRIDGPPAFPLGTYVVKTQTEWQNVWTSVPQTFFLDRYPENPKPLPQVDFQTRSAVGVSVGVGTTCYFPSITEVSSKGGALTVKYKTGWPDGPVSTSCRFTSALVQFALVPKFDGPVEFVRVNE